MDQYWTHLPTNIVYIVRVENDIVTQAFGGIPEHEVTPENLQTWNFPNDPEDVAWINNHRQEFMHLQYIRWYTTITPTENHITDLAKEATFKQYRGPMRKTLCGKWYATADRIYWGAVPQDLGGYFNNSVCPRCQQILEQKGKTHGKSKAS